MVSDGDPDSRLDDSVVQDELALTETLVAGLVQAIVAGVRASGVDQPFVVQHLSGTAWLRESLPGVTFVGGERFREAARAANQKSGTALEGLSVAAGDERVPDVQGFALADYLDEATAAACNHVNAAERRGRFEALEQDSAKVRRVLDEVAERLAVALNVPGLFGEVAEPFLATAMTGFPDPADPGTDAQRRARAALGDTRVDAFHASLASTIPIPEPSGGAEAARVDRAALSAWLKQEGVELAETVAAAAEPAFRLIRPISGESEPGTRLHGAGLLPPEAPWPRTVAGRDLAFLAAIDLAELGELPDDAGSEASGSPFPDEGWLLFFADIEDRLTYAGDADDGVSAESQFFGEETPNVEGADARLFFVPPGTTPVEAVPPSTRAGRHGWPEDRRAARGEMTLPDDYEAAARLGGGDAYWDAAHTLRAGSESELLDDWILGAATGVQGHPIEDGSVLLLHLSSVEFQDGGAIQFRIPPDALAAGDWSRAYAVADSG